MIYVFKKAYKGDYKLEDIIDLKPTSGYVGMALEHVRYGIEESGYFIYTSIPYQIKAENQKIRDGKWVTSETISLIYIDSDSLNRIKDSEVIRVWRNHQLSLIKEL